MMALGPRRLSVLAITGILIFATIAAAALYLNKPSYETLYIGLEHDDINRIGITLSEAGISFDVDSGGTTVMVPVGLSGKARMILAEKGLPSSSSAGYELFDNLGSLGLTSFMQEVTRVRALEGEIARSIQSMNQVQSARVHIVMSERGNFRRGELKPTASVVLRATGGRDMRGAEAIRHLVAAAVPGLTAENVTVLDSSGELLATGDSPMTNRLNRSFGIQRMVEDQIEEKIKQALAPYLGLENFRASVRTTVNTDQRQVEETIFDPESRVERSVQIVRSEDSANRQSETVGTTVEQNLPETEDAPAGGPQSTENSERREETTNYELSSKKIATISDGYVVSKMSVSVVINEARIRDILGQDATAEAIAKRVEEIKAMTLTAAGFDEQRGDTINVSAVEFIQNAASGALPSRSVMEILESYLGTLVNAVAFIVVAVLLIIFGVNPLVRAIAMPAGAPAADNDDLPPLSADELLDSDMDQPPVPSEAGLPGDSEGLPSLPDMDGLSSLSMDQDLGASDVLSKIKPLPQDRLGALFDFNEERAVHILRRWLHQEAA